MLERARAAEIPQLGEPDQRCFTEMHFSLHARAKNVGAVLAGFRELVWRVGHAVGTGQGSEVWGILSLGNNVKGGF